jgi:hypothetical protein
MVQVFIGCQLFNVLFILLHDWIPLGRFSNPDGLRASDSTVRLAIVTAVSTLPFAIGLAGTVYYAAGDFPTWLVWLLWISYGGAAYGILRAWYIPYLFVVEPSRIARYQVRFANTHAFLPMHNGIRPDTLHVVFHAVVLATIVLLVRLTLLGA